MNYQRHYDLLIKSRRENPSSSDYYEKHHILPRSLGGSDDPKNIIKLTAREHFFAHLLLAKIHGGTMWAALAYMSRGGTKSAKGVRIGARLYAKIRDHDIEWRRKRYAGERNPFFGKTFTPEQLEKLKGPRPSITGNKNPNFGVSCPDKRALISSIHTYTSLNRYAVNTNLRDLIDRKTGVTERRNQSGNIWRYKSPELLELSRWYRGIALGDLAKRRDTTGDKNPNYGNGKAISGDKNPMWNKKHKPSTRAKIGSKAKRRIECPHCGKTGNIANMHRWHLDNCKHKGSKVEQNQTHQAANQGMEAPSAI